MIYARKYENARQVFVHNWRGTWNDPLMLSLYTLGRFFCSERSTDISSTVYLIPNRQRQHSLISLRYMKLVAVRTREDHHCRRCHHRRASVVTLIIARAFSLSRALPSLIRSKWKRGGIIIVVRVVVVCIIVVIVVTFASRKSPPSYTC
jgi:hypothetical protein